MRKTGGTSRHTTRKPVANPSRNMLERAAELARLVASARVSDVNEPSATESGLDIPQLKKTIAQCRRAIKLQTRILNELEALVKDMEKSVRKKTPARSKKQKRE